MAAISLASPGTKYGPCKAPCQHRDCAATRLMAESICRLCGKPIGYDTRCYADPDSPDPLASVHASCLEDAIEAERTQKKESTNAE